MMVHQVLCARKASPQLRCLFRPDSARRKALVPEAAHVMTFCDAIKLPGSGGSEMKVGIVSLRRVSSLRDGCPLFCVHPPSHLPSPKSTRLFRRQALAFKPSMFPTLSVFVFPRQQVFPLIPHYKHRLSDVSFHSV